MVERSAVSSPMLLSPSLEKAFVLGLARQAIEVPQSLQREDGTRSLLGYLALLAARSRFERPRVPAQWRRAPREGAANYVDTESRRLMRRLFAVGTATRSTVEALELRVSDLLVQRGLVVHPFDRFALRDFSGSEVEGQSTIDPDEWDELDAKERVSWLLAMRQQDPAKAREHCAADLADQTAAVRNKWLEAFTVALSAADVSFLESCLGDRAKSVVERVTALLSRIPGTAQFAERLEQAKSRLSLKVGRLRRKPRLVLDAPAHLEGYARWEWVVGMFGNIDLAELAGAYDLDSSELSAAIVDDHLRRAVYLAAVEGGDANAARELSKDFDLEDFGAIARHERATQWTGASARVAVETLLPSSAIGQAVRGADAAEQLYELVRQPLPVEKARAMLDSKQARGLVGDHAEDPEVAVRILQAWLTVMPAPVRGLLAPAMEQLPSPYRRVALDTLELLDRLDCE